MKLIRHEFRGGHRYWFYCPGCRHAHSYTVGCAGLANQNWSFDADKLSFTPSLRVYYTHPETKADITTCHLHVTGGKIATSLAPSIGASSCTKT